MTIHEADWIHDGHYSCWVLPFLRKDGQGVPLRLPVLHRNIKGFSGKIVFTESCFPHPDIYPALIQSNEAYRQREAVNKVCGVTFGFSNSDSIRIGHTLSNTKQEGMLCVYAHVNGARRSIATGLMLLPGDEVAFSGRIRGTNVDVTLRLHGFEKRETVAFGHELSTCGFEQFPYWGGRGIAAGFEPEYDYTFDIQ